MAGKGLVPKRRSEWDEKSKLQAVQTYIKTGNNLYLTSKTLDISHDTLSRWCKQQWWEDLYKEFRQEDNFEISAKLSQIIKKSLAIIEDSLENGDPFYNPRTGVIERKPVSLRDAHMIFKDNLTTRVMLENKETQTLEATSVAEKLALLAKQFENIANKVKPEPVVDLIETEEGVWENAEDVDEIQKQDI